MDDALSIFCVTDLAEPPKELRRVSATSYDVLLNKWPKHLVVFVVGDWSTYKRQTCFDVELKRSIIGGEISVFEEAGSLSLQKPVLHYTTAHPVCDDSVDPIRGQMQLTVSCEATCPRHVAAGQSMCSESTAVPPCHFPDEEPSSSPVLGPGFPSAGGCSAMSFVLCSPRALPEAESESVTTPVGTPICHPPSGILSPPDSHTRPAVRKQRTPPLEEGAEKLGEIDDDWPPSTQPGQVVSSETRTDLGQQTPRLPTPVLTPPQTVDTDCSTDATSNWPDDGGVKRKRHSSRGNSKKPKKVLSFAGSSDQLSAADASIKGNKNKPSTCLEMSPRWGHTACLLQESSLLVLGGQEKSRIVTDSTWEVDVSKSQPSLTPFDTKGGHPERRTGHTAVLDPNSRMVYVYGGSKGKKWFSDIHTLDLHSTKWERLETTGQAPTRSYHSCTFFRGELFIFGGNYPNPDPKPDGCSNELHIFNPSKLSWYKPLVSGGAPQPRSGHSANLVDHCLVLFGGWDYPTVFNDLFVFDLVLMEFSKLSPSGTPPSPRSWHASCVLPDKRVFIHGGYDGDVALNDAFLFDLELSAWLTVQLPQQALTDLPPRAGHTAVCTMDEQELVVICGGGDNCGKFFSDTISVEVSAIERTVLDV